MSKNKTKDDKEKYILTPWGCLYVVLKDYHIDVSGISGTVGKHIVEDFMDNMVRAGHVIKRDGDET